MKIAKSSFFAQHSLPITILVGLALLTNISSAKSQSVEDETVSDNLVKSTPENVIWGELFTSDNEPILQIKSGDVVTIETISHEGILPDQGDTVEFFTGAGLELEQK